MKTLIVSIIAFSTLALSVVKAAEPEVTRQIATAQRPASDIITVAFADAKDTDSAPGECKAVCMLPISNGRIDLPSRN